MLTKQCKKCQKKFSTYQKNKKFCSSVCYHASRIGISKPKDFGEKVRKALLGKPHTKERIEKQSKARIRHCEEDRLPELIHDFESGICTAVYIRQKFNLSERVYDRYRKQYEKNKIRNLPSDFTPIEAEQLSLLSLDGYGYKRIASLINRGHKQTRTLLKKLEAFDSTKYKFSSYDKEQIRKETLPEKTVRTWLEENDIDFKQEASIEDGSHWYFDFAITNTKILVEVHGDYWHCNPKIYKNGPKNDWQRHAIKRDFCKKDFAKSKGYERIIVWEHDIKTDFENIKNKTIKRIRDELSKNNS